MAEDEARPRLRLHRTDQDPAAGHIPPPDPAPPVPAERIPHHDARDLACGGSVVRIDLDGIAYVLRITRNGKLILTK